MNKDQVVFLGKRAKRAIVGAVLAAGAFPAFAAVDVSDVVTAIGEAATAGAAIGSAVLLVIVAIKVFKWVRGAM